MVQVHEQDDIDQLRALWLEDSGEEAPGSPFSSQAASRAMNPATPSTQRSLLASFSAASVRRGGASVSDNFSSGIDDGESEEALGPLELALACDGEALFSPAQRAYIKAAAAQAVKDALADAMSWRLLLSTALFNAKRGAAGVSPRLAGAMERWLPNMLQRRAEEQSGG